MAALSLSSSPDISTTTAQQPQLKPGKKRGVDHKCESCSKIYRHPSCLIKHRWEHTPHWRESSKYVLSKHQQVQLLEAAAILSHLGKPSQSLPEDRSLWPSFLSGGTLPPPASATTTGTIPVNTYPSSSSVPSGPRLHSYAVPSNSRVAVVSTPDTTGAVPVPGRSYYRDRPSSSSVTGSTPALSIPSSDEDIDVDPEEDEFGRYTWQVKEDPEGEEEVNVKKEEWNEEMEMDMD